MLFSFWGSALAAVNIEASMYIAGGIIFLLQLPGVFLFRSANELPLESRMIPIEEGSEVLFEKTSLATTSMYESINETLRDTVSYSYKAEEDIPNKDSDDSLQDNLLSKDSKGDSMLNKTGFAEAQVPHLTRQEINRSLQTWIQFFVWMATFTPGFALKYTVAPVMSAVFGASLLLQTLSSFVFLFVYAVSRLVLGFVVGPVFSVKTVLTFVTPFHPYASFLLVCLLRREVMVMKLGGWLYILYSIVSSPLLWAVKRY